VHVHQRSQSIVRNAVVLACTWNPITVAAVCTHVCGRTQSAACLLRTCCRTLQTNTQVEVSDQRQQQPLPLWKQIRRRGNHAGSRFDAGATTGTKKHRTHLRRTWQ
jgi:hypothetical protein